MMRMFQQYDAGCQRAAADRVSSQTEITAHDGVTGSEPKPNPTLETNHG